MTDEAQEKPLQTTEEVKLALIDQLNKLYGPLIYFIRNMPIDTEMSRHAFQNLDQGVMWAERAIKALQFEVTKLPTEGTENDERKEDAAQASAEEGKETA